MLLEGKKALVTASANGIGAAIATRLAQEGAAVMVSDLADDAGEALVAAITADGGTAAYHHLDGGDPQSIADVVEATVAEFGGIDLAVNNVGVGTPPIALHEMPLDQWRRTIDITLTGTFLAMQEELKRFLAAGSGAIVNIASIAGLKPTPQLTPYDAAKAGVVAITRAGALEYAEQGIRINAVAPGATETAALAGLPADAKELYASQVPMKRLMAPEDQAAAVAWLLSEQARMVTGVVLPVDGGTLYAG